MRKICMFLSCLLVGMAAMSKEKAPEVSDLGIVGEGVGNGGSAIVTVTCSAKKADKVTETDLTRAAVRGVLFNGWSDKSDGSFDNSATHPPLAQSADAEVRHADYFKGFFDSDAQLAYVTLIPDTRKVVKSGKIYKVSQMATVNIRELRRKLEKDGVVRSLRSGW